MADAIHSQIIGWAYDGCPIYSKYGYSNPIDSSSNVIEIKSGWHIKTSLSASRPIAPAGTFVEDYEFLGDSTLDERNGRFCVTPEFPNGIYCYFATVAFPYFVGGKYRYKFDEYNHKKPTNNYGIPKGSTRIKLAESRYPEPENLYYNNTITTGQLSTGYLDSYRIEFGGYQYNVGDYIYFENTITTAVVTGVSIVGAILSINIIDSETLDHIPKHSISSTNGFGAILVFGSSTIGKIVSVNVINNGDNVSGDPTIRYDYNTDIILDVKYNNKIVGFNIVPSIYRFDNPVLVNVQPNVEFIVIDGVIVKASVVEPSPNYYEQIPIFEVSNGVDIDSPILPIVEKSHIPNNILLYYGVSITNYQCIFEVVHYNKIASTIQVRLKFGELNINENLFLWTATGEKIAKIYSYRTSTIYTNAASNKHITINNTKDSIINSSNVLHDNHKHQIYSYNIKSPVSIQEWKPVVYNNTHMLGNMVTGTYDLTSIIKLYKYRQQLIEQLVNYKVSITNILPLLMTSLDIIKVILKIYPSPEKNKFARTLFDYIEFDGDYAYSNYLSYKNYNIGDIIWQGTRQKLILGFVNTTTAIVTDYTNIEFEDFVYGTKNNSILSYNGVVQNNFTVNNNLVKIYGKIYQNIDKLMLFNFSAANLVYTDEVILNNQSLVPITVNSVNFTFNSNKFILFVNSVVNTDYTIVGNQITLPQSVSGKVFGIYSDNIQLLSLTSLGSNVYSSPTTLSMNNILVFIDGVIQNTTNYSINSNNDLVIIDTININYITAYNVNTTVNIDPIYQIVDDIEPDIIPAILEFVVDNTGAIIGIDIVYPGQYYPRNMKLVVDDGTGAIIFLESLNGSILHYTILDGGSGYSTHSAWSMMYLCDIQSQTYPLVESSVYVNTPINH